MAAAMTRLKVAPMFDISGGLAGFHLVTRVFVNILVSLCCQEAKMNQQSGLWKIAYDAAAVVLAGQHPDLPECYHPAGARDVAHAAMCMAGWTGDPADVAAAAEGLAEKLMRDGATD